MAFQTKKSVVAIVEETTEGTPIDPSAATEFIAVQEGYSVVPVFESLENAELTGSIGNAAPIQGFETPTAEISHYLRHSGTEGQAPNYGLLWEMAFGSLDTHGTERDVVSATAGDSTTRATITVDTGEGADYFRGKGLLIKDSTNGYIMRSVESVSGDVLTLLFNVSNAPSAGVLLGDPITYFASESHPTASIWDYRGNQAAINLVAGMRVTEASIEIPAGELINTSFSLEGIASFFNPITISASNEHLDFDDGGGEENAIISSKTYKDPIELAAEIQTKMDALTSDNITVTYSDSTGKYTIASDGGTLSLLWNTGTNTANTIGATIGFAVASDDTGATTYTSDNAIDLTAQFTPSALTESNPLVAKNNRVLIGDFDDFACFSTQSATITISNTKTDELSVCAESGKSGSVITERAVTVSLVANLPQYDSDKFSKFRQNQTVQFEYHGGEKSGGNWVAGKNFLLAIPTAKISEFQLDDADGLVTMNMTLTAFVDSGKLEAALSFL